MKINISPLHRITLGLLLLTISILLMGEMLGFVPNQREAELTARKAMAESLAIQISSQIADNKINKVNKLLNIIIKRNQYIRSVGLRENSKVLLLQTRGHEKNWLLKANEQSTMEQINIPIFSQQKRWGTLEVDFTPANQGFFQSLLDNSFFTMLLFVFIVGFILYLLFLKRVLSELDPSSVVPDRVRSAFDVLTEGLVMLDPSERVILVNTAFEKKLGITGKDIIGKNIANLAWTMTENKNSITSQKFPWSTLFETQEAPESTHIKLKTANHETLSLEINVAPIKAPNKSIKGAIVTINDITEIEKKNRELARILGRLEKSQEEITRQNIELIELATRDPLTHLLNRRSLFEGMNTLLVDAQNQAGIVSCLMLDIDHFKSVNDTLGHAAGDIVIKAFADIIQETIRDNDLVGRYGGEEFVVAMPGLTELEAAQTADKIRISIMNKEFKEISKELRVTSSFGVSSTTSGIWASDRLVDIADQALYIAKTSGRNRVVCYSQMDKEHTDANQTAQEDIMPQEESQELAKVLEVEVEKTAVVKENENFKIVSRETSQTGCGTTHTVILDRLSQAMKTAERDKSNVVILTIHIDTIQLVNNTFGHHFSEKLRAAAVERLTDIFRSSDSIIPEIDFNRSLSLSRSQDGNFIAILSNIQQTNVTTWVLSRMFKELSRPVEIEGKEIVMTANIGGSVYPHDADSHDQLLTNSKMALSQATLEGRGAFLFYDQEMNNISKQQLYIESQLHLAIERDELYLEYQPIINMKTGQADKIEALLRWKHPELNQVSPDDFIEIAEHVGLIRSIGLWVIKTASCQLKALQDNGFPNLSISINLSSTQFNRKELAQEIIECVRAEGISAKSVIFELTETAFIKRLDYMVHIMSILRDAGFNIALDDFGTGYSSLTYLRKLPISLLKIDRSVIEHFPHDLNDVSIVSGLIGLSHNLGIRVIAEGVEDEAQVSALHDLQCDEIQGYFISRPLGPQQLPEFLESTQNKRMMRKVNIDATNRKSIQSTPSLSDILNPCQ